MGNKSFCSSKRSAGGSLRHSSLYNFRGASERADCKLAAIQRGQSQTAGRSFAISLELGIDFLVVSCCFARAVSMNSELSDQKDQRGSKRRTLSPSARSTNHHIASPPGVLFTTFNKKHTIYYNQSPTYKTTSPPTKIKSTMCFPSKGAPCALA
jgi:hypothetical protein